MGGVVRQLISLLAAQAYASLMAGINAHLAHVVIYLLNTATNSPLNVR